MERLAFLNDLIHGAKFSLLYLLNRCAQLNLDLTNYVLVRMDLTPLSGLEADTCDQMARWMKQTQDTFSACLNGQPVYFIPHGEASSYAVIIKINSESILARSREVIDLIGVYPSFSLSIGISDSHNSPDTLKAAATECNAAARFAYYSAEEPVVMYSAIKAIPDRVTERVSLILDHILDRIKEKHSSDALTLLDNLFTYMEQSALSMETNQSLSMYMYHFLMGHLFHHEHQTHFANSAFVSVNDLLLADSLDDLHRALAHFVKASAERSQEDTADPEDAAIDVVAAVQSFVASHYQENFSLEDIAQSMFFSAGYLSRLFKQKTGKNISSYIQGFRIEKAKELLTGSNLKIYEIALAVGISDPVYFSRLFKNLTGQKPKDFRAAPAV